MKLSIDIETYSSVDLLKSGVYKYTEAKDFQILLLAYAIDDTPVEIIDLTVDPILPEWLLSMLYDPTVEKWAYNAAFERTCINAKLGKDLNGKKLPIEQWHCTMAKASMLGLPLSLDAASKVLHLIEGKSAVGKALIKYFSVPCKPTKINGERTRNLHQHSSGKWEQFKEYCKQDVVVEREIRNKLEFFNISSTERKVWCLDQKINDIGVLVDPEFIKNVIKINSGHTGKLVNESILLTGLDNPNSAAQLKKWLSAAIDTDVTSLTKESVPELLKATGCKNVTRVLEIRQEMAKTSIKKYQAMLNGMGTGDRIRGLLQYYGANRTGRWAGRLVQVQNLPKNDLKDLDLARQLVRSGEEPDYLQMLYKNVPNILSQLVRTAFIAPKGKCFIVTDFSAIEARVIAWLAGEKWRLDVFNTHGKIYEASAAQMFNLPLDKIDKKLRQKGKVAELALGYQGGANALVKMGALKMGLKEEELPKIVNLWRAANKKITCYWNTIEDAALNCVIEGTSCTLRHGIKIFVEKNILFIQLPSGRKLSYLRPKIKINKFGKQALTYEGMNQTTKQWGVQDTYGGKLVENITQAVARDCLAEAMLRLDKIGHKIVMHVHDEIVIETDLLGRNSHLININDCMKKRIDWALDLPLNAESYITDYYKKD